MLGFFAKILLCHGNEYWGCLEGLELRAVDFHVVLAAMETGDDLFGRALELSEGSLSSGLSVVAAWSAIAFALVKTAPLNRVGVLLLSLDAGGMCAIVSRSDLGTNERSAVDGSAVVRGRGGGAGR